MIRASTENINTEDYWEKCYRQEGPEGKSRVDEPRLSALATWVGIRAEEVQRHVKLLDVGCGLGDVARYFSSMPSEERPHYFGVDLSPYAIQECKAKLGNDRGEFYVGKVDHIPFSSEMFDVVWCGETLEHLEDPDKGIRELARVTGEGGFLVLSTPYRGRNRSPEHVWEFEPEDIARWGKSFGELVCLRTEVLPGWLTMFAVIRRRLFTECS